MSVKKKICSLVLLCVMLVLMLTLLSGCGSSAWEGEWNRTGDKTYSRSILDITDVDNSGFTFGFTLYNGNIAGKINSLRASFTDRDRLCARCDIDGTDAYILLNMNDDGDIDISFYSATLVEKTLFELDGDANVTGNYHKGDVSYLNDSFHTIGMLTAEEDKLIKKQLTDSIYMRCLDCFQSYKCGENGDGAHDDEIGAFVYYGSNSMQEYAGIIIIYDDGSVGIVVSQNNGSLLYYSDNRIYGSGEVTPLPVTKWMEHYNAEKNGTVTY